MWKKLGTVIIALLGTFTVVYAVDKELQAAGTGAFPSITFDQYSKMKMGTNENYTALDTAGSFLADQTNSVDPVLHTTSVTVTNSRLPSFITNAKVPSYSDIQATISNGELNSSIPKTNRWWLSDTLTMTPGALSNTKINPVSIASAKIVNENNKVNETDYTLTRGNDWKGSLPTEDKKWTTDQFSSIKTNATGTDTPFTSFTGGAMMYKGDSGNTTPFSIKLCKAVFIDDVAQPCSPDNPSMEYSWIGKGFAVGILDSIDYTTKSLNFVDPGSTPLVSGMVIYIGELRWTTGGPPASGEGIMVVDGGPYSIARPIDTMATSTQLMQYLIPTDGYTGKITYNYEAKKQKAYIRPHITIDQSLVKYIEKSGTSITNNQFQPLTTNASADATYIYHLTDTSMSIQSLQDVTKGKVKIDNANKKIKVSKGITQIDLNLTTTNLNSGYTRYVSAFTKDKNGNDVFGKIGTMSAATGSVTLDISSLIDTQTVGETRSIQFFIEDIDPNGISYISEAYSMDVEIVNPFEMSYKAKPKEITGLTAGTYEFDKNVEAGDKVGEVTIKYGDSPYSLTLVDDDAGSGAYQYFELAETSGITKETIDVKVKAGTSMIHSSTNSLKAGTYKFCITGKDDSGNDSNANSEIKQCQTITVNKTKPTITFDKDNDGTTYVTADTTQTTTHSEHAKHTNKDISDSDVRVIYSHKSGPASIIDSGLPSTSATPGDKANIVFNPNMSGNIVIQAKIDATDNYMEATTTKTLAVQLKLSGSYAEDKTNITSGSVASKPPASKVEANRIGHIVISGGTDPYTYELTNGYGNNSSFDIDTKGNIYVNASETLGLAPGDYEIKVVIKDKAGDSQQSATVQKKLTIKPASLSGVGWNDPANPGKAVTGNTITVTYDPASSGGSFNTKLLETTTGTLNSTTIKYTLDPDPNDAISMTQVGTEAVVTIQKASDSTTKDTVKLKAKITGGIYGNDGVTTDIYVNVEKYTQTIAFKDTTKLKLPVGSACVEVPAEITSDEHIDSPVIQYETSNTNANAPFTINADGKICPTTVEANAGTASLTGKLSGDDNFKAATTPTPRMIEVYKPGDIEVSGSIQDAGTANVTYSEGTHLVANDTSTNKNGTATVNKQVAEITDPGGGSLSFAPSSNPGSANMDIDKFNVTQTGFITLKQDIYAADIDAHATGNIYYIQVDVTDANNFTKTIDVQIIIDSAKADFYFVDPIAGTKLPLDHLYVDGTTSVPVYHTAYEKDGTITLKANKGATFKEDPTGASDVIDQASGGKFNILNASDPNGTYGGSGGNAYVEACMSAGGGYSAQCIYAQVEITKGEQPDFSFVNSPQWKLGKTPVEIQPVYRNQLSTGDVVLQSGDASIIEPTTYVSGTDQNFKTTGKTGTVTLSAIAPEDRNYQSKKATTTIIVSDTPPTSLTLSMSSPTYGDTNAKAQITNGYKAGTPAYFYTDDPSILSVDTTAVSGKESTTFTAHKASDTITVKVCQIKDPFDPAVDDCTSKGGDYGEITIQVKKKPIAFTFNDETIYTGEAFPMYSFKEASASDFAFTDSMSDITIPENASASCIDTLTKGEFDITGTYSETEKNNVMKNYEITVNPSKLTIKQDTPKDSWYELQDDAGNVLSSDNWYNHDVNVVLKTASSDAGIYDQISDTTLFNGPDLTKFKVTKEDDNLKDVYFRIDPTSAVDHAGAISEKTQTHVKIDKTPPIITSLTGEEVNQNLLARVVNTITFGRYMKPGTQVEVKANDQPKGQSVISGLKEIEYTIYSVDEDGNVDIQNPYDTDTINASETTKLPILSNGKYEVCAIAKDHAGNPSQEKCTKLWLKPIGEDSDGDGIPDINIDTDGDSIPDLNITKNPGDKIPWLNIDTNGDGKPDMNIDLDGDGIPDLNTGIITKWVCDKMGDMDDDGDPDYKTSSTVKGINNIDTNGNNIPDLNIDLDLDGLPELNINIDGNLDKPQTNIDGNGGGKANINIDTNGDGTPEQNVMSVPEWNPDHKVYQDGKIIYETMDLDFKPIEELEDNGVVVKPKDEHVSISPDMKLDVNNITSSTSEAEKEEIRLRSGLKNSEVKQVYNVNLLEENKIIQPNGKVEVKIPIDTSIKNPRIMMKAKDGTWQMMEAKAEGNYYVFETDYIGDVSVLGDQEATANDPTNNDDKTEDPKDDTKTPTPTDTSKNPDTSVKGTYTQGTNTIGMGGALTGDSTNVMLYIGIAGLALIMLIIASRRRHKE